MRIQLAPLSNKSIPKKPFYILTMTFSCYFFYIFQIMSNYKKCLTSIKTTFNFLKNILTSFSISLSLSITIKYTFRDRITV